MHLTLAAGDLLDQRVDVIVNAWNRNIIPWWLLLPQGVSGAIKKRAGTGPFKELRKAGAIPLGGAVLTSAGRLPFKGIIHVAGINMLWRASERSIRDSVRNATALATEKQFASIVFPLIGAGSGGFNPDRAKAIMLDELSRFDYPLAVTVVVYRSIIAGSNMNLAIRHEAVADHEAIRQVNRLAFGRDDEARLVDALRDGGYVRLSLVAEIDREVVGHILFSQLSIVTESGTISGLALAPMAVAPERQRRGIGSQLVERGLNVCRENGQRIAIVLGHPEFYPRFGFSAELAGPLRSPFSGPAWMALELTPAALDGVSGQVVYPPPFGLAG